MAGVWDSAMHNLLDLPSAGNGEYHRLWLRGFRAFEATC
jgi:hypothetical protein